MNTADCSELISKSATQLRLDTARVFVVPS